MRKFYALFTALLALFAINVHADRVLYTENYEAGAVPTTWKINGGAGSIAGDEEGKYLSFKLNPSENGRSAHCLWGESIFDDVKEGLEEYTVSVDFQFQAFGSNQYNGEIAFFSGENCQMINGSLNGKNKDYAPYSSRTNCLFSITQNSHGDGKDKGACDQDGTHWFVNGDSATVFTPVKDSWYTLTLTVNPTTREVAYSIDGISDESFHKTGSKIMSEEENLYVSGLYVMNARYLSVTNIDNIVVSIAGDFANEPVIALTGVKDSERTYTISFMEGETLHVTKTDGSKVDVDYDDCETPGQYVVTTTTSGTISAYTTLGEKTSTTATQEVVCEPIVLPAPTYNIISASEGFGKTYQFNVDNSDVPMNPEIFMDFSFKSEDGSKDFTQNNQNNGATVELPTKGTLTITTKALGYANGTATIVNDKEFVVKQDIDLQHITGEQLTEKGFAKMDDLNSSVTSGENNWTGRLRMNYQIATGEKDDEGNDIYTTYPVYGFTSAIIEEVEQTYPDREPIQRYQYLQSKLNEETAHSLFAPLYLWYGTTGIASGSTAFEEDGVTPKLDHKGDQGGTTNVKFYPGIGLVFSGQLGDEAAYYQSEKNTYAPILVNTVALGVDGLTDDDFIVVSKITDYGTGSVHPKFPAGTDQAEAKAQYKAMHLGAVSSVCKGTETFELYRVDTALNRVLVLSPANASGIDEIFNAEQKVISDHNAPVYNMSGVRVNNNSLQKGIYIKQGKKFVVK